MQYSRLATAVGVALFLAGGSLAYAQQSGNEGPPAQADSSHQHHAKAEFRQMLTPELRVMWRKDHKAEMASMSREQRRAYKRQLREQFAAMNPQEQAKTRDELQSQWAKLDPARQQKIEQRIAAHDQRHAARHGGAQQQGYPGEMAPPPSGSPSGANQL